MKAGKWRRKAVTALIVLLFVGGCAGQKKETGNFDETKGTPAARLGEDTIYLEEAVFYTRMLQEQWEQMHYDEFGPGMWQEETQEEGLTLGNALKRDVMEFLTEIHLLSVHADEYGVELTEEDREALEDRAENFMASNTPEVLEAAGATKESVACYLTRNVLAEQTAEQIRESGRREVPESEAAVGRLTYALFSVTGTYDAEGNYQAFTEEELEKIRAKAEAFAKRAQELGDISAAGEEFSHTVIDAYFNETDDGGAHEKVAEAARSMAEGGVSDVIETEEGYYVVQHVSALDEEATEENRQALEEETGLKYLNELEEKWKAETPLEIDQKVWDSVKIEEMLTEM